MAATREVLGNATSVTMMGIERPLIANGTIHAFTVQARNTNGWGPESSRPNIVHLATVPSAPNTVPATAGIGSALVSWLPGTFDGGSPNPAGTFPGELHRLRVPRWG